jgi:hypothetical protein
MELIESILLRIAVISGAILSICALGKKLSLLHKVRKWFSDPILDMFKEFDEKNTIEHQEIKKHLTSLDDKQLKQLVCDKDIPLKERVIWGREYVDVRGLNGPVKIQHHLNCEEFEKDLKGGK